MKHEKLKLFSKTRCSLSEEDRVVNALLIVLQDSNFSLINSFFKELGIITNNLQNIEIRDHIAYDLKNIVDGEILIPGKLLIAIEAKIQKNQFDERYPYLEEILGMLRKLYNDTPGWLRKRIFNPEQTL